MAYFNPRAPCGARPQTGDDYRDIMTISIRVPLAGHDRQRIRGTGILTRYFNPRAPCGARPAATKSVQGAEDISIHVPLAGHDGTAFVKALQQLIFQSTCPLRGTTWLGECARLPNYFNPRAPCGARRFCPAAHVVGPIFQSTCPLRGTTFQDSGRSNHILFQSTCPLRGTTAHSLVYARKALFQSTCPLRGTTQIPFVLIAIIVFQSTCPLRGTTLPLFPP